MATALTFSYDTSGSNARAKRCTTTPVSEVTEIVESSASSGYYIPATVGSTYNLNNFYWDTDNGGVFYNFTSLTSAFIPATIEYFGSTYVTTSERGVFSNCTALATVTFETGTTITYIGKFLFYGCSALTTISIPTTVTSISEYAFQNSGLETIDMSSNEVLTVIDNYAFENASNLNSVILPPNVTALNENSFSYTSISTITIPSSITTFKDNVFYNCASLTEMIWEDQSNFTSVGTKVVLECNSLTDVYYYNASSYDDLTDASKTLQAEMDALIPIPTYHYVVLPSAPVMDNALATGSETANVYFTPASDGGSVLLSYTVRVFVDAGEIDIQTTSYDGQSVIEVTGLTSGETYTFSLYATNVLGNSSDSNISGSVTTFTIPSAPEITNEINTGGGEITLYFNPPTSDGGTTIIEYVVVPYIEEVEQEHQTYSYLSQPSLVVTELNNGTAYTFKMYATNAVGNGIYSNESNSITPSDVPDAPIMNYAISTGAETATVFFTPAGDGGTEITHYYVRVFSQGDQKFLQEYNYESQKSLDVTGLITGTTYYFYVFAENTIGESADSVASNEITTFSVPDAPTGVSAASTGTTTADVYYTPGSDGGTPILYYTVNVYLGNNLISQTQKSLSNISTRMMTFRTWNNKIIQIPRAVSTISVTGLLASTSYTFTLVATNAVGSSEASARTNSITTDAEKAVTVDVDLQRIMQMSSYGQFWYGRSIGFPGFLYKKNGGGGCRRSTKFIPGLGTPRQNVFNTYVPGSSVGAVSTANRRALRRAIQKQTIKLGDSV